MPRRIESFTKEQIINASLPAATSSYTVIPHKFVIDTVEAELQNANLEVDYELYKSTRNGSIATSVLRLKNGDDQEMRMMFAWSNSYDKSMRFKCTVGGYLPSSGSIVVSGNMGSWGRKHTGKADEETLETIKDQISKAGIYYNQLIKDKEAMKNIILTEAEKAAALGIIFFEHALLSCEQANIIRSEMRKPSYNYNAHKDSVWVMYCNIIYSLQKSHPKNWLDQQRLIHFFMQDIYGFNPPEVEQQPSNQITLEQMIADVEAEQSTTEDNFTA